MLKVILLKDWDNIEQCKEYYNQKYAGPHILATYNKEQNYYTESVMCIAFADQLKYICSSIFGIPVKRFYENKSNAWICINKDFHYTEIRPDNVITCEEYYYNCAEYKNSSTRYYLSLRDILVYIGTYVLQQDVNKEVFINIVRNTIQEVSFNNPDLKFVIVTDIRFTHEFDYVNENNYGIYSTTAYWSKQLVTNGDIRLENGVVTYANNRLARVIKVNSLNIRFFLIIAYLLGFCKNLCPCA